MRNGFLFLFFFLITTLCAKDYRGAEYRTKESFTYGRFEVRMKSAQREGMLSSFFTYNDSFPSTPWNEIDIEILGRYTDDVQFNPITPGQVNHEVHYQTPFNPAMDFHIYAFEWTPKYVAWFVDGKEVHRQTGAHIEALTYPQKIMMNIWNPSYPNWVGAWNANVLPAFAWYDWVSYASYAPDSGNVGTNNNFKLQWKDDFNSFDANRWIKASHTWGGNQSDMYPDNIVFKDGYMILCLTTNTTSGFYDHTPPSVSFARAENKKIKVHYSEEVDAASATTPGNYYVNGKESLSAALQPDSQTVFVTVSDYDTSAFSNIIVINTKDRFSNALVVQNIPVVKQKKITFPIKINCGGSAYAEYLPDQEWNSKTEYGHMDGRAILNSAPITGTSDTAMYHSELNMPVKYCIRVPNGTYNVELHMAETSFSTVGSRIFSIAVQGTIVEQNLDLIAAVGKNAAYKKTINNVTVTNELIDIHFMSSVNYAIINGIIVAQVGTQVGETHSSQPLEWNIEQNFPNPFNPSTIIQYQVKKNSFVALKVFDVLGKEVATLVNEVKQAGAYSIPFNASSLSSGVYFYQLLAGDFASVKKMVVEK